MIERKLKLALPKGWLIKENRWSVRNILELSGIGKYMQDGIDIIFKSEDPEIDATAIRPGDIPYELMQGSFDAGITGNDLVIEEYGDNHSLEEILNLNCSYIEMSAISSKDKINIFNEKDRNKLRCKTRYPNIAKKYLLKKGYNENNLDIRRVSGSSEEYLTKDLSDIIVEVVATGESVKKRDLVILEKIQESTAGLYANRQHDIKDNYKYKVYEKFYEIIENIQKITNEVKELCQVSVIAKENVSEKWKVRAWLPAIDFFLKNRSLIYGLNDFSKDSLRNNVEDKCYRMDFIVRKKHIQEIKSFFEINIKNAFKPIEKKNSYACLKDSIIDFLNYPETTKEPDITSISLSVYNLQTLYLYCPIFEPMTRLNAFHISSVRNFIQSRGLDIDYSKMCEEARFSDLNLLRDTSYMNIDEFERFMDVHSYITSKETKYPCVDYNKLRPKHKKEAFIWESRADK